MPNRLTAKRQRPSSVRPTFVPAQMEQQNKLLVAAMHCIDAVGSYARDGGFSPDHKRCSGIWLLWDMADSL